MAGTLDDWTINSLEWLEPLKDKYAQAREPEKTKLSRDVIYMNSLNQVIMGIRSMLKEDTDSIRMAMLDGEIQAVMSIDFYKDKQETHINFLAANPRNIFDPKRKGPVNKSSGAALIEQAIRETQRKNFGKITLSALNDTVKGLYAHLGFEQATKEGAVIPEESGNMNMVLTEAQAMEFLRKYSLLNS